MASTTRAATISSAEAFTLSAESLDNSNGKLLSNQGLTLRIANALNNVKGLIGAASTELQAASLNNSGGSLVSRGDLELTVDGLLRNDASGLINAAQASEYHQRRPEQPERHTVGRQRDHAQCDGAEQPRQWFDQ